MKDQTVLVCVAIGSISALEIANMLVCKEDGVILSAVIGIIAGLVGYQVKTVQNMVVSKLRK